MNHTFKDKWLFCYDLSLEGMHLNVGIIGTGSMGTILIEAFLESEALAESQLIIYNRTIEKAKKIQKKYSDIHIEPVPHIANKCEIIFLCVKPLQFYDLLQQLQDCVSSDTILVSITSPISIKQLESIVACKVARAIPTILNRALSGPSLLSFSKRCSEQDKKALTELMKKISTPLIIEENITRVSSDIVSCGPAFFSYILQQFIEAATRQTEISKEEATTLATDMMIGLGKLLEKKIFTLETLQKKVCVPGGITGEGLRVLESGIGDMFDQLFRSTHAKYYEDKEKIAEQFSNKENVSKH